MNEFSCREEIDYAGEFVNEMYKRNFMVFWLIQLEYYYDMEWFKVTMFGNLSEMAFRFTTNF